MKTSNEENTEERSAIVQVLTYKPYFINTDFIGLQQWLSEQDYTEDNDQSRVDL